MRLLLALLAVTVAATLLPAGTALAVPCDNTPLTDDQGIDWLTDRDIGVSAQNADALRKLAWTYFERNRTTVWYFEADENDDCTLEDGDREMRYPVLRFGDLDVTGTIWVPQGSPAFARALVILRNPGTSPAAFPDVFTQQGLEWLPADVTVVETSSGDLEGSPADDWMVLENGADNTDPRVALLWHFGSDRRRSAAQVYDYTNRFDSPVPPFMTADGTQPVQSWGRVVVPPGGIATFMIVGLTRGTAADAAAAARELQSAPDLLLSGMSDDEKRGLQNVGLPDRDLDGAANGADNCVEEVNADQADLDADGQGDVCDADDDGDTIADDVEVARGTDPRNVDSDGDGRRDDADACPVKAGLGTDGCARFDTFPAPPDRAAPGVTIRRPGARMRLRAFRRGVPCVVDLDEAAAVVCRLLVRARRVARIAAAGDLEVARRSLPLAAGRRSARLRPRRRLIRQRRFRATLQVIATDAAGNRTVRNRRFRVR